MVSVLVADVRGCERKRRTYSHVKLSQKSLFRGLWSKHRETVVTRSDVVERAALSPTFHDGVLGCHPGSMTYAQMY